MPATADKTQRMIFMALPFVFVPFIIQLPGRPHRLLDHDEPLDHRASRRALRKIIGRAEAAAADAGRDATGPFGELLKQFRKPRRTPRRRRRQGGARAARKRQTAAVSTGSAQLAGKAPGDGSEGAPAAHAREPGAKPPPPRARTKKRSGRRADGRDGGGRGASATLLERVVEGSGLDAPGRGPHRGRRRCTGVVARRGPRACSSGGTAQTIDAVQHLAQRLVLRDEPASCAVVIDAEGYRERRAEVLRAARPTEPPTRRVESGARSRSTR